MTPKKAVVAAIEEPELFGAYRRQHITYPKSFLSVLDITSDGLEHLLDVAASLKVDRRLRRVTSQPLAGRHVAMLFEKPSLRTRTTFVIAVRELGGEVIEPLPDVIFGGRESVEDVARNLERWAHGIVARTFKHKVLEELAANAEIPVINGLSDFVHPCQSLADFFTLHEKWGDLQGRTMTYVGDGNNTCHSLIYTAVKHGTHIRVCSPEGYEPNARVVNEAMRTAQETGCEVTILNDPDAAADGADAIYTDVWASMGQEKEYKERKRIFADYRVDLAAFGKAAAGAIFMHCLPAHRDEEITDEVMESRHSVIYDQAENRLHAQKAVMALTMS